MSERQINRGGCAVTSVLVVLLSIGVINSVIAGTLRPGVDRSDLSTDQLVDDADLRLFSLNFLQAAEEEIDWCGFYQSAAAGEPFRGRSTRYYRQHYRLLLTYISDKYLCPFAPTPWASKGGDLLFESGFEDIPQSPLLAIRNNPKLATRIGGGGQVGEPLYVSDPEIGSVFVYESGLVLSAELKQLDRPLGVAVDSRGYILIGNDGRDNVEVYDPADGNLVTILGGEPIRMPTAITIMPDGRILVTDSRRNHVRMFDTGYQPIATIGKPGVNDGELSFPTDAQVITRDQDGQQVTEVFVADQGNRRIQVFDLAGNWLRSIDGRRCSSFSGCGPQSFARLQALAFDSEGRLHALDMFVARVAVVDPATGSFITTYGEYGDGPGQLRLPMDLFIDDADRATITTGDGTRIEVLVTP